MKQRMGWVLGLAVLSGSAAAGAGDGPHRYEIAGNLTPAADSRDVFRAAAGTSRLVAEVGHVVQSGQGFEIAASLVASPEVCYGDTIFEDGFDP